MSTAKIQNLIARACFGKEGAPLDFEGIAEEDRAELSPGRLRIYRRLLRHNVTSVIETMLASTKERLGPLEMERAIEAFLDAVGPQTPHLRDVPSEFLAFAAPRWRSDPKVPRWIADHAELELLDFVIGVAPRSVPPSELADVTADRPLVFAEPKALVRLDWAVNAMESDEPEERPVAILVYRDAAHASRFLELTPLAAAILERLFAGDPLGMAMTTACGATNHPLDGEVLAGAARLLADLGERGVLLGARAT